MLVAGIVIGSFTYDLIGRRTFAISGLAAVAIVGYAAGGAGFLDLRVPSNGKVLGSLSILLAFTTSCAFAATYTMQAEIPTPALKEYTIAYSTFWLSASTIATYMAIPYVAGPPGLLGPKMYLVFAACATVGFLCSLNLVTCP